MVDVELGVGVGCAAAERVEVGDQVAAHAVHVDEGVHLHDLLVLRRGIGEPAAVGEPARRLVGHAEAREHVVVEAVLAEQELVDAPEELAALGAADDAVVVGVGERGDLAHCEPGDRVRIGAFELGRVADAADADDEALPRHQPRHRVHGADHPRVRDRRGGAGEVVRGDLVAPHLHDELFVRAPEAREVEGVGLLHVGHQQRVRAVALLHVDREAEVHVLVAYDDGLAVLGAVRGVERREVGERAHDGERDQVREADLAGARARELVVEDLAVDLEQLRGDGAHRRRGGDAEARLHVLDRAGSGAPQRLGLVAVEDQRTRSGRGAGAGGRARSSREPPVPGAGRRGGGGRGLGAARWARGWRSK